LRANPPSPLWIRWLLVACACVALFGLTLVVAPALTRQAFSLLVYFDLGRISSFGEESARYVSLTHAVLGSVMFGWGVALAIVVKRLFAHGHPEGWLIITISVCAWFIPDTMFSALGGFWSNVVLNVAFLVLFAIPLLATRKYFKVTTNTSLERARDG
jgi:hypothetical protein